MGGGSRTRHRSIRAEREYIGSGGPRDSRSERSTERQYERRSSTWVGEGYAAPLDSRVAGYDRWNDNVDASVTAGGSRRHYHHHNYTGGHRHHHRQGDHHYKRYPYGNNQYHSRYYYSLRDPYTGRFIDASEDGPDRIQEDERGSSSRPPKGFFGYLKEAFGGYSQEKGAEARKAYKDIARKYDGGDDDEDDEDYAEEWSDARKKQNGRYDDYDDDMYEEERYRKSTYRMPRKSGKISAGGDISDAYYGRPDDSDSGSPSPNYNGNSRNAGGYGSRQPRGYAGRFNGGTTDTSSSDRSPEYKTKAGGIYGDYYCDPCGTVRPERRCCSSAYRGPTSYDGDGSCCYRSRSYSLRAGGQPGSYWRGRGNDDGEDVGDRRRSAGTSRRRPRATSVTETYSSTRRRSSRAPQEDRGRDRSSIRGGPQSSSSRNDDGGRTFALERQRPGTNNYVPPSSWKSEPDGFTSDDDPGSMDTSDDSDSASTRRDIQIPPFMEGKISSGAFESRIPIDRILNEGLLQQKGKSSDESYYMIPKDFGAGIPWHVAGRANYDRGNMYCSDPGSDATIWASTGKQSSVLMTALCRDSLRDAVKSSEMPPETAVLFLVDAALRMSAMLHAGPASGLPKSNPLPAVFKQLPEEDAALLKDGPYHHARGATAGILRSSYGALAYWPAVRAVSEEYIHRSFHSPLMQSHKAVSYIAARTSTVSTSLSEADLDAMAECFSAGVVAAAAMAQFLYVASARMLHPSVNNDEYEALVDAEPYVRNPLGSEEVVKAEATCIGSLDTRVDVTSGIPSCVLVTHLETRSAVTELMAYYSEYCSVGRYDPGTEATACFITIALLLQRYLAYLNILACELVIASMYHGKEVKIRERAFSIYGYLSRVCSALYRPVSVGEFSDDKNKAMKDIGCVFAKGDPPEGQRSTLSTFASPMTLREMRIAPYDEYGPLGDRIPLPQAVEGGREVLFGIDAISTAKAQVTGRRSLGHVGSKRLSNKY